jgi:hypothetical protein
VVDDQIRHQIHILSECFDICPVAQARIDPGMIDGIEASIDAINRVIKGEDVNAAKQSS